MNQYDKSLYEGDLKLNYDTDSDALSLNWNKKPKDVFVSPFRFPTLEFTETKIPVGDGPRLCLSLYTNTTEMGNQD